MTVLLLLRQLCFSSGLGPIQVVALLPLAVLPAPAAFPFSLADLSPFVWSGWQRSCLQDMAACCTLLSRHVHAWNFIHSPPYPWKYSCFLSSFYRGGNRYRGWMDINFLWLLSQTITGSVALNHTSLFSYSSRGQHSEMGLIELKGRFQQVFVSFGGCGR